jgi:hypothetical protein
MPYLIPHSKGKYIQFNSWIEYIFFQTFNGKKWEKFNSEKVASLAYARIQGRNALIAHFQNSSLMNEEKWCRPMLFHKDGPHAGDQVRVILSRCQFLYTLINACSSPTHVKLYKPFGNP